MCQKMVELSSSPLINNALIIRSVSDNKEDLLLPTQ